MEELGMTSFWRDRPTFVTGATGLVGSWLVKSLLRRGADVVCLVRDWIPQSELQQSGAYGRVRVVRGDIRDKDLLERILGEYEVATVFHLAAQTIVGVANRNPISTFETNITGTWNLLEACRRSPQVREIVVASSDKAYGTQPKLPYTENSPLCGEHPYDVSKSCADLISRAYSVTYGLPVAVTRCGNFFGGGDLNWNRIVPGTIRSVLRGERPVIRSDGSLVRDYFYVEDGAEAYILLAEKIRRDSITGEAFNFSYDTPYTVLELVRRIIKQMDSEMEPLIRGESLREIREQHLSSGKARSVLGWKATIGFDAGLDRTIDWYRAFFAEGVRDAL